jgi:hypothetical protein
LLDFELGLEVELKALRNLETATSTFHKTTNRKLIGYRKSVSELGERFRRKYGQLDNPEAAAVIAAKDEDPLWRIEAAAALHDQPYHHALGLLERRSALAAFNRARDDTDPLVRNAVAQIANTVHQPPKEDNVKPL